MTPSKKSAPTPRWWQAFIVVSFLLFSLLLLFIIYPNVTRYQPPADYLRSHLLIKAAFNQAARVPGQSVDLEAIYATQFWPLALIKKDGRFYDADHGWELSVEPALGESGKPARALVVKSIEARDCNAILSTYLHHLYSEIYDSPSEPTAWLSSLSSLAGLTEGIWPSPAALEPFHMSQVPGSKHPWAEAALSLGASEPFLRRRIIAELYPFPIFQGVQIRSESEELSPMGFTQARFRELSRRGANPLDELRDPRFASCQASGEQQPKVDLLFIGL